MNPLDHDTFHAMEIDALYEELDGPGAAAIRGHAASCGSCAARFERLRRARQRGLSVLVEAVPEDFESRIMAAVDAALAKRAAGPVLVSMQGGGHDGPHGPPQARPGVSAKVIPFFARPSFAVAATLILVLGAAAILSQMGMARKASSVAMGESAPAAVAASGYTPVPVPAEPAVAPTATAATIALGEEQKVAAALGDPNGAPRAAAAPMAPAAAPPPMLAAASTPEGASPPRKSARPSAGAGPAPDSSGFAAAKALYDAGRYAEALPRFEALKASSPEADLYAARCIQKTRGCTAAAPRFDAAAQRNSGTEVGSRARLEAGTCYQQIGQAQAARTRYQATKDEGILALEAASDLDALDRKAGPAPAATRSPGTPAAGKPSSPKAADTAVDDAFR